jgi:ribonuclease-3
METVPEISRDFLNSLVGTKIKNTKTYQRAFTHKSALKRYTNLDGSYETLEFMGDSVLGFIITKHLFDLHEKEQEGFLTKARTKMVRGKTLCEISKVLGLDKLILMDEKGERNGWNTNEHIMEDVFEALIGAIYIDLGMVHAKNFILESFKKVKTSLVDDNYKDQLMRWCQALKYPLPEYVLVTTMNGMFCISVSVNDQIEGFGYATTKKQAEQNVAEMVLKTDPRFKGKNVPAPGTSKTAQGGELRRTEI